MSEVPTDWTPVDFSSVSSIPCIAPDGFRVEVSRDSFLGYVTGWRFITEAEAHSRDMEVSRANVLRLSRARADAVKAYEKAIYDHAMKFDGW